MKTYTFKLYRTAKEKHLWEQLTLANEVWNFGTLACLWYYEETKKTLSKFELMKVITAVRKCPLYQHWKRFNSQAAEDQIKRIYFAYDMFFAALKKPQNERGRISPPKPRSKAKQRSWTLRQCTSSLDQQHSKVRIGGVWFRYHSSRKVQGNIKTMTIKHNTLGEWFVFVVSDHTETTTVPNTKTGKSVGFDFGLKQFLTGSDGSVFNAPEPFKAALKEVQKAHRELDSKRRGSRNRKRALQHLERAYERITNLRSEFHWKLANELVQRYDVICLETLCIEGMKALWGRKISDLAFYSFVEKLKEIAAKHNTTLVFIDRWFPSSKTCSDCGYKHDGLALHDREWKCPECGAEHNRDHNAAVNIHREGMRIYASQQAGKTSTASAVETDGASSVAGAFVRPASKRAKGDDRTITQSNDRVSMPTVAEVSLTSSSTVSLSYTSKNQPTNKPKNNNPEHPK